MKLALLAGTHSGCGKTTAMLALLQYLKARHLKPRAFKTGPDFLDPLWHTAITGCASYNLDTQMVGIDESRRLLERHTANDELVLIEGVMGMFDGRSGVGQAGSSVDLARELGAPVILVVDAQGMSGTIAPLVSGFCGFADERGVKVAGIVANRAGSEYHAQLLCDALAEYQLPRLLAWIGKEAAGLEERHLGLKMPAEDQIADFQSALHVDEPRLLAAFGEIPANHVPDSGQALMQGKTVAIAKDQACCFIYPGNIDWLLQQGARIRYFSPLAGEPLPEADALWLPGGYPELHAGQLSVSSSWPSLKAFIEAGKPVLAECGGAMILGKKLIDNDGAVWPMADVLPFVSRMQNKLAALGYRQDATGMRGHEFHFSVRESDSAGTPAFSCNAGDNGIRYKNLRASYIHWYFASAPEVAAEWFS